MPDKNIFAVWSTAMQNNLPDSSFAYIEPGGKKDSDGKTTPRSLRHLPYKDASGAVDAAHAQNALARLNQTDAVPASQQAAIKAKLQRALATTHSDDSERHTFTATAVTLDSSGNLPTRIPILVTGNWENSTKGDFSVDADDLKQIKENYDGGVGFPTEDASTGLAIDFKHDYDDQAAGWIKGMEYVQDPNDSDKATLYANPVEWTDAGAEAIKAGRFKCISPMGFFGKKSGKLSQWSNPTNLKEKVANVIEGAGLTNIPFLRGMQPIRADKSFDNENGYDNVIYVYDLQQKHKEPSMTLDEVRTKEREELTVPELDFIIENKTELNDEEVKKFKLDDEEEGEELSPEDKATLDALKSGDKKLVDAKNESVEKERLDRLEATAKKYETEKVETILDKHVKRGAIKQDQTEFWGSQLLNADDAQRKSMEDALDALPENKILAEEIGTSADVLAGSTTREQYDALAREKVAKAAKEGKELIYADALRQVSKENKDLVQSEQKALGVI